MLGRARMACNLSCTCASRWCPYCGVDVIVNVRALDVVGAREEDAGGGVGLPVGGRGDGIESGGAADHEVVEADVGHAGGAISNHYSRHRISKDWSSENTRLWT